MPEFLFVPGRSSKKTYVNTVRSHVAKSQYAASQKTESAKAQRDALRSQNNQSQQLQKTRRRVRRAQPLVQQASNATLEFPDFLDTSKTTCSQCNRDSSTASSQHSSSCSCSSSNQGSDSDSGFSNDLVPLRTRQPTHPVIAKCSLLQLTFIPFLMQFYFANMMVDIPEIDLDRPGSLRNVWFPWAVQHEAIFRSLVVSAGSLFLNHATLSPSDRDFVRDCLLEHKMRALSDVQGLLADPETAVGDVAIASVLKLGCCEAVFGTRRSYMHHMDGLARMIKMRGGVKELGVEGVLGRMVYWVDFNAACLHGTHCFVEGNDRPQMTFDAQRFVGHVGD